MTEVLEKKDEPDKSIKEKCIKCLKGPNLISTIVIVACGAIVLQQITTCVTKLIDIPISTYTHFDFNKSIVYPSVTFCREPPYKYHKLLEYGLFGHPMYTSEWRNFNFSVPLDKLWKEITYEAQEFFVQYGLNSEINNVEVKENIGFVHGRCYTVSPKVAVMHASKATGLSITLQHDADDISNSVSVHPPGYHVYVHYTREPFTEVTVYNGGLVDYLYCNVGETIDTKLSVNQYIKLSKDSDPCTHADDYSANNCTTEYVWDIVGAMAGCSGPWMRSSFPYCQDSESMSRLIAAYMALHDKHNGSVCPRFCSSYLYQSYVNERHTFAWDTDVREWTSKKETDSTSLQIQLYMYFNSMMVSVYEERYTYDWNLFISDLGGTVGFLLGLSVISLLSMFDKFWSMIFRPSNKAKSDNEGGTDSETKIVGSENIYKDQDIVNSSNNHLNNYLLLIRGPEKPKEHLLGLGFH